MKRRAFLIAGLLVIVFAAVEAVARLGLGLGDPPLTIRDPEIDYLFAPSKTYHRFGNTISYNAFSMRADEVTPRKHDPHELRVIVMGDSVINGGALTDDSELATRLAQTQLAEALDRPVWIGNVSAGSWGPGNLLAYARRYGWFDADVVIIILSSQDISDIPNFQHDLGSDFPREAPLLAVDEAVSRYLVRYAMVYFPKATKRMSSWSALFQGAAAEPMSGRNDGSKDGLRLLNALLEYAKSNVSIVAVLHHFEQYELSDGLSPDGEILQSAVRHSGVSFFRMDGHLKDSTETQDHSAYRDSIHINALGQRLYAEVIECVVWKLLESDDIGDCRVAQKDND